MYSSCSLYYCESTQLITLVNLYLKYKLSIQQEWYDQLQL